MPRPLAETPAETIRSRQNVRLKDLRRRVLRSGDDGDGLIAIEGEHLLEEAARSGLRIDTIFLREDRFPRKDQRTERKWPGDPQMFTVAADAFNHACATESPQGVAALVERPQWSLDRVLGGGETLLMVLAGLQDPGNVGTILRSAEAFGAAGVLLTPGSVHPWNQKVLRASAGSSFRLPTIALEEVGMLARLGENGIPLYGCSARNGVSIADRDLRGAGAFVIGNEGAGIPEDVLRFCSGVVHIPCPGAVESLNAAVAASILLYEAARQRTAAAGAGEL